MSGIFRKHSFVNRNSIGQHIRLCISYVLGLNEIEALSTFTHRTGLSGCQSLCVESASTDYHGFTDGFLSLVFVFEIKLLTADGSFEHQTAFANREHNNAAFVVRISGGACFGRNRGSLGGEG